MATLAGIKSKVEGIVQDDEDIITTAEEELFIDKAVTKINKVLPKEIAEDIATDGSDEYSMPTDWITESSIILKIFWEYDDDSPLEHDTYEIVTTPSGRKIRFESNLTTGKQFRVVHTTSWTCTGSSCDLPEHYADLVEYFSITLYAEALNAYYSQTADSTIDADIVNYKQKATQYSAMAERFMNYFKEGLKAEGVDLESGSPIMEEFDWDLEMIYPGKRKPLTHSSERF